MMVCKWLFGRKRGKRLRFRPDSRVQVTDMSHVRQKWAGGQVKQMTGFDGVKAVSGSASSLFGSLYDHPNEPAGFTLIAENNYQTVPGAVGGGGLFDQPGATGWWWRQSLPSSQEYHPTNNPEGNVQIKTNGGHPLADTYMQIRYPVGMPVGVGPCFFIGWNSSITGANQQAQMYVQQLIRLRGPDSDPNNYQFNANGTKLYYASATATTPVLNQNFIMLRPSPTVSITELGARPNTRITMYPKYAGVTNTDCANYNAFPTASERSANLNIATATQPVNQWFMLEQLFVTNTPTCPGTADGLWKMWVNEVLCFEYPKAGFGSVHDGAFRTISPNDKGFYSYRFDPVYGGTNGPDKDREDFLDIAYTYISGIPL